MNEETASGGNLKQSDSSSRTGRFGKIDNKSQVQANSNENKQSSESSEMLFKERMNESSNNNDNFFKAGFSKSRNSDSEGLFFNPTRNSYRGSGFFNPFGEDHNFMQESDFNFLHRQSKSSSKLESTVYEQNSKKYKQILRDIYNNRYYTSYSKKIDEVLNDLRNNMKKSSTSDIEKSFQATRLIFNKQAKIGGTLSKKAYQQYLVKKVPKRRKIFIYQLKNSNPTNFKPFDVDLLPNESYDSIEYDLIYKRIFYFNNFTQEIVVKSLKKEILCRLRTKFQRYNPLLYIHRGRQTMFLLVIGGFKYKGELIVEGSQYIEIYKIGKWEITLKPASIRLNIGRISPIVFSWDQDGQSSVYLLGGNSNAQWLARKGQLNFKIESQDLNFTTNQTGVRIEETFIESCFYKDSNNQFMPNNLNIRFVDPLNLYDGCVLLRKLPKHEKLELILQNHHPIFNVRIIKKDVHIFQSDIFISKNLSLTGKLRLTLGYHRDQFGMPQLRHIDNNGDLQKVKNEPRFQGKRAKQCKCSTM